VGQQHELQVVKYMSASVGIHSVHCYYLLGFLNFKLFYNDLSVLSVLHLP